MSFDGIMSPMIISPIEVHGERFSKQMSAV